MSAARDEILRRLHADRPLAHKVIFAHRHTSKSGLPIAPAPFHREMIEDWHGPANGVVDLVFRGGAKSTIAEEAIAIMAGFREFRNCLILGESYDRAAQRLYAIRREFEANEKLYQAFGPLLGPYTAEDRLILSTGACIQALGMGQALRGIKHEDQRPDLAFGDDLENLKTTSTPEARKKVSDWFTLDLLPALDPEFRIRVAATPLHPESLAVTLTRTPGWVVHKYPLYYFDEEGAKRSSWPERFPIEWINKTEQRYIERGQVQGFRQEYMCESEAPETKPFRKEQFLVEPQVRTWQAVYSMTDPARTVSATAADTGRVVWSWIKGKLVVWDAVGRQWMPSEVIDDLFQVHEAHRPTWMGFEEDGLNLWAMQAIRQEQARRGVVLPVHAEKAPRGKTDFIRGLQPFFRAREIEFAKPLPELEAQLLGFPNGRIDIPNALAYALKMRPGASMYDDFGARHVVEDLRPAPGRPVWMVLNATHAMVTAVLVQVIDGSVRILADDLREGEPSAVLPDMVAAARLEVGGANALRLTAGPAHFSQYANVGLRQAAMKLPADVDAGIPPERARSHIRGLLQRERQGMPMVLVASQAHWTLNALNGGYARVLEKGGVLADYAEEGPYRVLMEGLESFLGLMDVRSTDDGQDDRLNAVARDGRRYTTMVRGR
jgi:hypothetical protein